MSAAGGGGAEWNAQIRGPHQKRPHGSAKEKQGDDDDDDGGGGNGGACGADGWR